MKNQKYDVVVHATHEAGFKVGGIGAVLDGLLATDSYNKSVRRTILVGPLDVENLADMARLTARDNRLEILFSTYHGIDQAPRRISDGLRAVRTQYRVHLLYGRRVFGVPGREHEVLLVDGHWADLEETNQFKAKLYYDFGVESNRYEWNEEYDRVVKDARPAFSALNVLLGEQERSRFVIAHEWMGLLLAFCARIYQPEQWKLVFYAHEMATARLLIEDHPGHDTRFYNVLKLARISGMTMEQVFGDRSDFFKHVLVKQAVRMDAILAVGYWVRQEFRFLGGAFPSKQIDLVFNGVSPTATTLEERHLSLGRMKKYCLNLLGYRPDYVFTHVTRLIVSKGIWRDIRVLEHLDKLLTRDGKSAVFFVLATSQPAGRDEEEILRWEADYGWPVVHHFRNGDLVDHEKAFYQAVESFNVASKAIKIVFVNQFGWNRERCGQKMPSDMSFLDVRRGTHLEFGQSIYEPFGISQVEPLGFGALSVVSNICGCIEFLEQAKKQVDLSHLANLIQADYVSLTDGLEVFSVWDALWLNLDTRNRLEKANSYNVALAIRATLPVTEAQERSLLTRGQRVSQQMSWEKVTSEYLLPVLDRIERDTQ